MLAYVGNVVNLSDFENSEVRWVVLPRTEGDYKRALDLFDMSVSSPWLNFARIN
jgi:hypothetical protein